MTGFDDKLHRTFNDLAESAPHQEGLAESVRHQSHYGRAITLAPAAVAAIVVAVVCGMLLLRPAVTHYKAAGPSSSACSPIQTAVLPTWARAGFSDPQAKVPMVASRGGTMLAVIFASPLSSPAPAGVANKILWVTNAPAAPGEPLNISGHEESGPGTSHTSVEGGPGPSYVDVAAPGCWVFDLTWGTRHDVIALPYAAG